MKRNLGNLDRLLRVVLAAVIAVLFFTQTISGTTAKIFAIFAIHLMATSALSFSLLYLPLGLSTRKQHSR